MRTAQREVLSLREGVGAEPDGVENRGVADEKRGGVGVGFGDVLSCGQPHGEGGECGQVWRLREGGRSAFEGEGSGAGEGVGGDGQRGESGEALKLENAGRKAVEAGGVDGERSEGDEAGEIK